MSPPPHIRLLRHSTYLTLDNTTRDRFIASAQQLDDWDALIKKAEFNGISHLLYTHLNECRIPLPEQSRIILHALTARHARNNRERSIALAAILKAFSAHGIDAILLKGMALIQVLYREQCQRPMSDIDILVEPHKALAAQQVLRDLGYNAADRKQGYQYNHHHLPIASKMQNGLVIQVEVHRNALSGDAPGSIAFAEAITDCIPIEVDGNRAYTLSHRDMLKHLCHHTFESITDIKLGAVADIYGYANRYCEQIDWEQLHARHRFITNALRCLHFLSPLPEALSHRLSPPTCPPPEGVGKGFPTLSSTLYSHLSRKEKLHRIFACSPWWQHIYYRIPPENSLLLTRYIKHPLNIGYWILRRAVANAGSRVQRTEG